MLSRLILVSSGIVFLASLSIAGSTDSLQHSAARMVCWQLHYAGISLGMTNGPQVRRLLGDGLFRKSEGESGGLYFLDIKRRATLHAVMYTDFVVGELTIMEGIDSSINEKTMAATVSKYFDPEEGFGNWHALHLGATKADVLRNLGAPAQQISNEAWKYFTSCSCEIPQFFTIYFRNGRIFKITFSAPAG